MQTMELEAADRATADTAAVMADTMDPAGREAAAAHEAGVFAGLSAATLAELDAETAETESLPEAGAGEMGWDGPAEAAALGAYLDASGPELEAEAG